MECTTPEVLCRGKRESSWALSSLFDSTEIQKYELRHFRPRDALCSLPVLHASHSNLPRLTLAAIPFLSHNQGPSYRRSPIPTVEIRTSARHIGRRQIRSPPRKSRPTQPMSHTSHTALRRSGPCLCWVLHIGSTKSPFMRSIVFFSFWICLLPTLQLPLTLAFCHRTLTHLPHPR